MLERPWASVMPRSPAFHTCRGQPLSGESERSGTCRNWDSVPGPRTEHGTYQMRGTEFHGANTAPGTGKAPGTDEVRGTWHLFKAAGASGEFVLSGKSSTFG